MDASTLRALPAAMLGALILSNAVARAESASPPPGLGGRPDAAASSDKDDTPRKVVPAPRSPMRFGAGYEARKARGELDEPADARDASGDPVRGGSRTAPIGRNKEAGGAKRDGAAATDAGPSEAAGQGPGGSKGSGRNSGVR